MKHLFLMLGGILLFSFSACKDEDPANTTRIVYGSQATIPWQDCALFADQQMTICFVGANEARCPCNTNCLWEGSVDATLHVTTVSGIDTTFTLTTNSNPVNLPNTATIGGKTIQFVNTDAISCSDYGQYEKYKVIITVH
jgi:hypothetical protein